MTKSIYMFLTIKNHLKSIPVAMNGIAISLLTLFVYFKNTGFYLISHLLFTLAILVIIIKTFKYLIHRKILINELNNYIQGGYLPLYSMFIAGLASITHVKFPFFSLILWYAAFFIHIILLIYLYLEHYKQKTFKLILPSWFIPPIGFIAVGLGAINGTTKNISSYIFIFSAIVFIPLSIAIIYRQIKKPLNEQEIPTSGIYAAPVSLLVLAYLDYFPANPYPSLLLILFILNIIYNSFSYIGLYVSYFKLPYTHTIASFTFTFAVAAVSFLKCEAFFQISYILAWLTSITALIVTFYVLIKVQMDQHQAAK